MKTQRPALPRTVRLACAAWLAAAAAIAVFGVSFIASAATRSQDGPGLIGLGVLGLVLAAVGSWGALQLRRGRRSGRETLTSLGLILGVPLLFRGAWLAALGVALLACTFALWLPETVRYLRVTDPRPPRRGRGRNVRGR